MNITDNKNFNNSALPIEQIDQIEDNSSGNLSPNNKAGKLERYNNSDNYQNNNFTLNNNTILRIIDKCVLIFNIIILICACTIFPGYLSCLIFLICSFCYISNQNPSVRFIAKINLCLYYIYATYYSYLFF